MSRPTLSIVMTNYNDSAHLPESIAALQKESASFIELIVVDDGSTDESLAVLERLAMGFDKLRVIRHERNCGVLAAFNTGLDASRGEWVYGAAADDLVLPGFIEEAMRHAAEHPDAGLIFGRVDCVDRAGRVVDHLAVPAWSASGYYTPHRYLREHLDRDPAGACFSAATIYRLAALRELGGFREDLALLSDLFTARAIGLRHGVVYLDRPCVRWTYDRDSFSVKQSMDPTVTGPLGEAMFAAMSEPALRELFPEPHRQRWALRWQLEMVGGFDLLRDAMVPNRLRDLRRAYAHAGRHGRWFDRLLSAPLRLAFSAVDARRSRRDAAYQAPPTARADNDAEAQRDPVSA